VSDQQYDDDRGALADEATAAAYRLLGSREQARSIVEHVTRRWAAAPQPVADLRGRLVQEVVESAALVRQVGNSGDPPRAPKLTVPLSSSRRQAARNVSVASVDNALQRALQTLSSAERIAFVASSLLRLPRSKVSELLNCSEDEAQVVTERARQRVRAYRPMFGLECTVQTAITERLLGTLNGGDEDDLSLLLAPDAVFFPAERSAVDGAEVPPIHGAGPVAALLSNISRRLARQRHCQAATINNRPGLIIPGDTDSTALILDIDTRTAQIETVTEARMDGRPAELSDRCGEEHQAESPADL
jgi:RNA polymerase sigma-70 factor (ECF subfamily)